MNAKEKAAWESGQPPTRLRLLAGHGFSGAGDVMVVIWDAVREVPEPQPSEPAPGTGLAAAP